MATGEPAYTVLLLSALGMAIFGFLLLRRRVDFFLLFSAFFLVMYVFTPLHLLVGGPSFLPLSYLYAYTRYGAGSLLSALVIIIGYLSVTLGYHSKLVRASASRVRFELRWKTSQTLLVASLLLCLSFVSMVIYALQYGGLERAIRFATLIRSGAWTESGPYVFMKHFMGFSCVSLFLVFTTTLKEGWRHRSALKAALGLFSCLGVILTNLLIAGRGFIIELFLVLYLTLVLYKRRLYIPFLLLIGAFAFIFILVGEPFFHSLYRGELLEPIISLFHNFDFAAAYQRLWQEFMHPYISLEAAIATAGEFTPRFFLDWIYALLCLVPERLIPFQPPETIAYLNTELVIGVRESVVPPGLLAFLWYSALLPGVIFGGVVFGAIGRWLDTVLGKNRRDPLGIGLYILAAFMWGSFMVMYSEPRVFFLAKLTWLVLFFCALLTSRWYVREQRLTNWQEQARPQRRAGNV